MAFIKLRQKVVKYADKSRDGQAVVRVKAGDTKNNATQSSQVTRTAWICQCMKNENEMDADAETTIRDVRAARSYANSLADQEFA